MRRLPPAIAEDAKDEAECAPVVLGDQRNAFTDRLRQIFPGLLPGLALVGLVAELDLELLPQLVQKVVVGIGGRSDRYW